MPDDLTLPGQTLPLLPLSEEDADEMLLTAPEKLKGKYTLERVQRNEERLAAIIQLLAAGAPVRMICRTFHCSPHTLAEIRAQQGQRIATVKQGIARKLSTFVELAAERLVDEYESIDLDKLAIALGIAADKLQVLTGEASVIVGSPADQGPRYKIDDLRARLERKVGPGTGSEQGEDSQTGASAAGGSASTITLDLVPAPVDSQSPANHS